MGHILRVVAEAVALGWIALAVFVLLLPTGATLCR